MSGVFTGSYCIHPFTGEDIPVWISDYVLVEYGTGAIMAVPGHDQRDHAFCNFLFAPVLEVIDQSAIPNKDRETKAGIVVNSDFLNGLEVINAIERSISKIEEKGIGKRKISIAFAMPTSAEQRYWGEPIPVVYNSLKVVLPWAPISCRLSFRRSVKLNLVKVASRHWLMQANGSKHKKDWQESWIPCQAMQDPAGIFFVIWIRAMRKFCLDRINANTGEDDLLLAVQNTQ